MGEKEIHWKKERKKRGRTASECKSRNTNTLCRYAASFAYCVLLCNSASYARVSFARKVQVKLT